jgi:predicted nucleotidyltransferase
VKASNNEHISIMTSRIVQHFNPVQIILFGSYARGEAHPHSDVDLLVVFAECADKRKTAVEIRRVLRDMPVPKDIIVSTPEELERKRDWVGTVLRPAQKEGVILYEGG